MRRQEGVVRLFPQFLNGEDLFGLNEPAIIRVLESLNYLWLSVDYLDSRKQSVKERNIVTLYIYVFVLFAARRPFIERALIQATVVSSVTTRVSVGCNRWRSFRTDGQRPPPHSFHTHKNSTKKKKLRIDNNRNGRGNQNRRGCRWAFKESDDMGCHFFL